MTPKTSNQSSTNHSTTFRKIAPFIGVLIAICIVLSIQSCDSNTSTAATSESELGYSPAELVAMLDTVYITEQTPIRLRDSLMRIHGAESEEVNVQQLIYEKNHAINEAKVRAVLDASGWPDSSIIGARGNRTICNVLQHSDPEVRVAYLPMMKEAVKAEQLNPQLLARAEDRIATDRGELQIYGGQMKYYPETKSFNVWPVFDPANIDMRRAEIGLGPIDEYLMNRFEFEWNLEEQIQRSQEFEAAKNAK